MNNLNQQSTISQCVGHSLTAFGLLGCDGFGGWSSHPNLSHGDSGI